MVLESDSRVMAPYIYNRCISDVLIICSPEVQFEVVQGAIGSCIYPPFFAYNWEETALFDEEGVGVDNGSFCDGVVPLGR